MTVPVPFKLASNRIRAVVNPVPVPTVPKARPIPKTHYRALPKTQQNLAKKRDKIQVVKSAAPKVLMREGKKAQVAAEEPNANKTSRQPFSARPTVQSEPLPFKVTASTIMREEALIRRKFMEEKKGVEEQLEIGVAGTLNRQELAARQLALRQEQERVERVKQAKLKLQVQLAHEEAQVARIGAQEAKHEIAKQVKSISESLQKLAMEESQRDQELKQVVIEAVAATRQNAKERQAEIHEQRKDAALEMTKEKDRMMAQKAEREAREMEERRAVIQQIRALEQASIAALGHSTGARVKLVDRAESSGAGVLGEMSLVELHERYHMLKDQLAKEEAERREKASKFRQEQKEMVEAKARIVAKYRKVTTQKLREETRVVKPKREQSLTNAEKTELDILTLLGRETQQEQTEVMRLQKRLTALKQLRVKSRDSNGSSASGAASRLHSIQSSSIKSVQTRPVSARGAGPKHSPSQREESYRHDILALVNSQ